jgi:hypothetical protein
MAMQAHAQELRELQMKTSALNTRIYTAISVGAVFVSAIAFVLQMVIRLLK